MTLRVATVSDPAAGARQQLQARDAALRWPSATMLPQLWVLRLGTRLSPVAATTMTVMLLLFGVLFEVLVGVLDRQAWLPCP